MVVVEAGNVLHHVRKEGEMSGEICPGKNVRIPADAPRGRREAITGDRCYLRISGYTLYRRGFGEHIWAEYLKSPHNLSNVPLSFNL